MAVDVVVYGGDAVGVKSSVCSWVCFGRRELGKTAKLNESSLNITSLHLVPKPLTL